MDKPTIGIRQADGSFYEIMGDAHGSRKRLVLSAARTDQHGVKIELFRSTDGTLDQAASLGTISLDDPDGLGFQDIEFRVDLDPDGVLEASAALPGQPPRTLSVDLTPFRDETSLRTDADILDDDSLAHDGLDDLGDAFNLDPEPMTLDFPEADAPGADPLDAEEFAAPDRRSDADLLADDLLGAEDLDTLDLGSTEELTDKPEPAGLAADSFDLDDLDAGFGEEPAPGPRDGEPWEKISLDDMEAMEFMDTGDEISRPKALSPGAEVPQARDEFSLDDDQPLELGDLDDLNDLPDLDLDSSPPSSASAPAFDSLDTLDQDFLDLDDHPDDTEVVTPAALGKAAKAPPRSKEKKASRSPRPVTADESSGGLDKTALILSLSALSLLVLLILVLLFLNMIKAPTPPVIQPEVMGWKPSTSLAAPTGPSPTVVDLGDAQAPVFEASSVLEVPEALKGALVSLKLAPGETVADAQRRFGPPARTEGVVLSW